MHCVSACVTLENARRIATTSPSRSHALLASGDISAISGDIVRESNGVKRIDSKIKRTLLDTVLPLEATGEENEGACLMPNCYRFRLLLYICGLLLNFIFSLLDHLFILSSSVLLLLLSAW